MSLAGSNASCCSRIERTGRDGLLRLAFERRADRTVLVGRRFTLPLQALEPLNVDDGAAYLLLLNPTGGIVGGDRLRTIVELGPGAHVALSTPSATKVYRARDQAAIQETEIRLGEGAILEYLPDHLIPHPGAALRQTLRVAMGRASRSIIYDAFASGRIGRGERWCFRRLESEIAVTNGTRPWYLSRSSIVPARYAPQQAGLMDGFDYLGTMVFAGARGNQRDSDLVTELVAAIDQIPGVRGGASLLAAGGCSVRFLAPSAECLTSAMRACWGVGRQLLLGLPAFALRKF